jgi:histone H3/H4
MAKTTQPELPKVDGDEPVKKDEAATKKVKPASTKKKAKGLKKTVGADGEPKRKRKYKPGRLALRQICKIQGAPQPKLALPKSCFTRLVKELLGETTIPDARITRSAIEALQEAAEAGLSQCFNVANALACDLNKSATIKQKHMRVARNIIFHPHKLSDSGIKNGSLLY